MAIKVHIPPLLQKIASNREIVEVKGATVRECISDLIKRFPGFREWLDENNPIAWVTLNRNIIGVGELDQKVSASDELRIVLLLAGG
jgi:molybdopterin converting factor small subunit